MRRSIFFRYFTITACILLAGFVVLGSSLLTFTKNQWRSEKQSLLTKNVRTISEISSAIIVSNADFNAEMQSTVTVISRIISADIYIINSQGYVVLCSDEEQDCRHYGKKLEASIVRSALSEDKVFRGNMGGMYNTACFSVSTPITADNAPIGAVFASVPVSGESSAVMETFRAMFYSSILILLVAFILMYIITLQTTRPLRQMAIAARKMENGEFIQIPPVRRKDEIGELIDAFNRMSHSLGQLEEMRRSFISSVSHELKTPMTSIAGFVDGMLDGTIPEEDYPKYLGIVSDETKRLSRLVNSMLQLSRLENDSVRLNCTTFNVSDLLVRILLSFESRIEQKHIEIRGLEDTDKVMLFADSDLMYQVIYNLVENAIKFTPDGGYISVLIAENKDKTVTISIENSGEGLSQVELSRVFERFYKTDRSRSTDKTGMGFGLYIVKMIVGLHKGQITAESVRDEFTKFTVVLPNRVHTAVTVEDGAQDGRRRFSNKKNDDTHSAAHEVIEVEIADADSVDE